MKKYDIEPYAPAPQAGLFEEINIFGTPTGVVTVKDEGEPLPGAPRGFAWRPLSRYSVADLRARATQLRDMAGTAATESVRQSLLTLADRFDALAAKRESPGP